jgi:hypothetical protein
LGVVDSTSKNRLEISLYIKQHNTSKSRVTACQRNLPHFVAGFSSFFYLMYQWQSCCDVRANPFPLPSCLWYIPWACFVTFGNESVFDILQIMTLFRGRTTALPNLNDS